jgi:hypothetical protein
MEVIGQLHDPAALPPGKEPGLVNVNFRLNVDTISFLCFQLQ